MKRYLLLFAFIIFKTSLFAQHTERYLDLTKDLKPVDSSKIYILHKNRNIHYAINAYIYEINKERFISDFGEKIYYRENETIKRKTKFDDFGNVLLDVEFDKKGGIIRELKALKIDFKPELDKALNTIFEHEMTLHSEKIYKYSRTLKTMFLFKEGKLLDDKRHGKWIFYKENGEVAKEKIYK